LQKRRERDDDPGAQWVFAMSSLKQIAANRCNALKSTGPTTPEGKERSRRNAVRHGLTAETVIPKLEDAEDYQAVEAAVIADYDAETAVERELVLRLSSVLWRLRRATGIESALFEYVTDRTKSREPEREPNSRAVLEIATLSEQGRVVLIEGRDQHMSESSEPSGASEFDINRNNSFVTAFLHLADLESFPLDRLSRYEHLLWRQARQLVFTLETLRRRVRPRSRSNFPFSFRPNGK
jgi:hypothetical protein